MSAITESAEIPQELDIETKAGPSLFTPLKHRSFTLFWIGESVSVLGSQFHLVAMSWLALQLTGSGLALGTVFMAAAIPRAIFMLVGGALADRVQPRLLMIGSNLARGLLVALLTGMIVFNVIQLWHLYVIAVLFGVADALFYPAFQTFYPGLVDERELEAANGLVQATFQLTNLIGPVLAGLLVDAMGNQMAFGVDSISFFFAVVMLSLIRSPQRAVEAESEDAGEGETQDEGFLKSILEAIKYVAGHPVLRTVIAIVILINFAINGPFSVGLPVLADDQFGTAKAMGWMFGAFGAGALLGAVVAGSQSRPKRMGQFVSLMLVPVGVGMVLMGFATQLVGFMVILALMGLAIGSVNVFGLTWFQTKANESGMMGRVMSLIMLASVGVNIFSAPLAGWGADLSLSLMFIVGGGLFLMTALGSVFDRNYMQAE